MEPNQDTNTVQSTSSAPTTASVSSTPSTASNASVGPSKSSSDVVFRDKPKKNMGVILTIVLLVLLAAGGIGFGVWAMMDGSAQVAKKDEQIADLRGQLAEKNEAVVNKEDVEIDVGTELAYKNPVIKPDSSEITYSLGFESSYILEQSTRRVGISIMDGRISLCRIMEKITDSSWNNTGDCVIEGLEGDIYKVIEFGQGQMNGNNKIGFIMENCKVAYLGLYDFASSNTVSIKGYLNVDGCITDALEIGVSTGATGGYGSTVFVFDDGSFVKYDDSMLNQ